MEKIKQLIKQVIAYCNGIDNFYFKFILTIIAIALIWIAIGIEDIVEKIEDIVEKMPY